jgi:predicted Zn-dependent protease
MRLLFSSLLLRATFIGMLALFFTNCARNPVTGKKEISLMSESQELAMGKESDPQIIGEYGIYPDSILLNFLTERGKTLGKISHRPNLDYQFRVMDSEVVNAFAVPGGFVYFTRGIFAHFNNEAQMMGVMGHEIGHVTARHSAAQMRDQTLGQIGLIVGMIAFPTFQQLAQQATQGMQLMFLKFSRDHESQSDKLGVDYSSRMGYDAHEMAKFFNVLGRLSGGEDGAQRVPTFMSTHPDPGDRFAKVNAMATEYQTKNPPVEQYRIEREKYLRLIDGIVYGPDPRQGYVEANVFYHPELKFQFPVPTGWQTANSPSQFRMASTDKKAMMTLTLAPEKTLEAAAAAFPKDNQLQVVSQKNVTINGLPAIIQYCDQVPAQAQPGQQQQQQTAELARVLMSYIQYNGLIYKLFGVSPIKEFSNYERLFANTINGFQVVTDASKINVVPERIKIQKTTSDMPFSALMQSYGMPEKRLKELAILNQMELTELVPKGTSVKTFQKTSLKP